MGTGDLCRVPQAAVRHGRTRQSSGTGPFGACIRVLWLPGPRDQYLGKIRFIENLLYKTCVCGGGGGGKRTSDSRVAYPEVKGQVRDLVRVVGIVAHFDQGRSVPGKNSFYRVPGVNGHRSLCRVSPAAVCHGRARQSSGTGPWGL